MRPSASPRYTASSAGTGAVCDRRAERRRPQRLPVGGAKRDQITALQRHHEPSGVPVGRRRRTAAGSARCQATRPVAASSARHPPSTARNTRPSPTAGAQRVSAAASQRTRPESRSNADEAAVLHRDVGGRRVERRQRCNDRTLGGRSTAGRGCRRPEARSRWRWRRAGRSAATTGRTRCSPRSARPQYLAVTNQRTPL